MIMLLNNTQTMLLEYISFFGYLSVGQAQKLTDGLSNSYVRQCLALLKNRKLLNSYHVQITAKIRAEDIYYLTPAGRECLLTYSKVIDEKIRMPLSSSVTLVRDYEHRRAFIDLFLSCYRFFEKSKIDLLEFMTYYDKTGNQRRDQNLESKTKLVMDNGQFIIPDGIMLTESDRRKTLYLIEMFCDKNHTKRILQSLGNHARVIASGVASQKYDLQNNPIVLSAFSHAGIKEAVIKRLQANEKFMPPMSTLFHFITLEDAKANFGTGWEDIHGNPLIFQ